PSPTSCRRRASGTTGEEDAAVRLAEDGAGDLAAAAAGAPFDHRDLPGAAASPSSTAIGVLTFTPSVPSATSSFDTLPSSTASTSMVALSVSISAMMSPGLTVWPSLTSHLASLPSSMVGDSAGIRISVGIAVRGGQTPRLHIGARLERQREGS